MTQWRSVVVTGVAGVVLAACGGTVDLRTPRAGDGGDTAGGVGVGGVGGVGGVSVAGSPSGGTSKGGSSVSGSSGGGVAGNPSPGDAGAGGASPFDPPLSCLGKENCPWSVAEPMPLHARGHAAAAHEGHIYLLGGESVERDQGPVPQDDPLFQKNAAALEYDPSSQQWTDKAPLLAGLYSLTAHSIGKLYAFGGYGSNGFDNTLQIYDPAADLWSKGVPMPTKRYTFTSELVDGKVYVVGGAGPTEDSDVWERMTLVEVFDPASGWSTVSPMRYKASEHASCSIDGHIYVFGGETGNRTQIYDVAADEWSLGTASPVARRGHACVQVGGRLLVLGGRTNSGQDLDLVELYDAISDSWRTLDPMPHARYWFAAANLGEKVYIFGGISRNGLMNDVDVLDAALITPPPGQ